MAPYEASLPPLQRSEITDQHHLAHARWLATTMHTLAAATAALAQAVYTQATPQVQGHALGGEQPDIIGQATPSPAEPDAGAAASPPNTDANESEPTANLEVATCADH